MTTTGNSNSGCRTTNHDRGLQNQRLSRTECWVVEQRTNKLTNLNKKQELVDKGCRKESTDEGDSRSPQTK